MPTPQFAPALFTFLADLSANNDRAWFQANKDRYLENVQEPALAFIVDFAPRLAKISPHFSADARVVGGSLFRIQRDTRFSKDKTPYKTNTGVQFRHEAGKDAHAPGFYLHLQPGECFVGAGLWRPEAPLARRIREAIAADPAGWRRAAHGARFTSTWALGGELLVRVPAGFDPTHPFADDLRRKDFIASTRLADRQVTAPGFDQELARMLASTAPLMRFLCAAVGVPF
jgi:uncharacterized protein (TIGR02453 family)